MNEIKEKMRQKNYLMMMNLLYALSCPFVTYQRPHGSNILSCWAWCNPNTKFTMDIEV